MPTTVAYYRRLYHLYRDFRRRRPIVASPPLRLWVELSSECNLRCVMCPNSELPPGQRGFMEWRVFHKVIDEAREYVFDVTLHHRGESLLHPQALRFIRYAASQGLCTKLHSNGTRLDRITADRLVDSGLNRISFSFDGFVKEDYEKIRRGADFDQTLANIRHLLERRGQLRQKFPLVAVEVIELSPSQQDRGKMRRFAADLKKLELDELVIKKPHNWAGYLRTAPGPGRGRRHYSCCTFPWNALLVLFNGDVLPCSQDFFGKYPVGNVGRQSLLEIWNGEPMQRLRLGLAEKRLDGFPACRDCDRPWRRTAVGVPREYLRRLLFKKLP